MLHDSVTVLLSDGDKVVVETSSEIVRWGVVVWKNGNKGRGGGGIRVGMMIICMVKFESSGDQHFIGCGRLAIGIGVPLWRSPRVFRGNRGGRGVGVWEFNCSAVCVRSLHVLVQWVVT